jgi:DNA-binding NtrC family response regulator
MPVTQKRTILVIDDDPDLLKVAARVLTLHGYEVLSALDCTAARAHLDAHPDDIDLLLTDIELPGMCGDEFAASLAGERPELKVLLASGYPARTMQDAADGVGDGSATTMHFIEKPYAMSELARRVQEVLEADPPAH